MGYGDHIYVHRFPLPYSHHGIDCGGGVVVHYNGEPLRMNAAKIEITTMKKFLDGGTLQVRTYDTSFSPDETVYLARSRVGEQKYQLLFNNCEHFAAWCKTGLGHSEQIKMLWSGAFPAHRVGQELFKKISSSITGDHYMDEALKTLRIKAGYDASSDETLSSYYTSLSALNSMEILSCPSCGRKLRALKKNKGKGNLICPTCACRWPY